MPPTTDDRRSKRMAESVMKGIVGKKLTMDKDGNVWTKKRGKVELAGNIKTATIMTSDRMSAIANKLEFNYGSIEAAATLTYIDISSAVAPTFSNSIAIETNMGMPYVVSTSSTFCDSDCRRGLMIHPGVFVNGRQSDIQGISAEFAK